MSDRRRAARPRLLRYNQAVLIRPATEADFVRINALLEQGDALHAEALPHVFRIDAAGRPGSFLAELASDPRCRLLVAVDGGHVVGVATARLRPSPPVPIFHQRSVVLIEDLGVDERYRRQGIGRRLIEELERWAESIHADDIQLNVYEFNESARRLYESLGYDTLSRRMTKRFT